MNEQLEGKVQIWKGIIEENRTVLELGKEVLRKQNTAPQLDVRKCSLETYDFFSPAGYDALIKLLDVENTRANSNVYTVDAMKAAIQRLENTKLPFFT